MFSKAGLQKMVSMAHAHVEAQHNAQLVEHAIIDTKMSSSSANEFPERNLEDEEELKKLLENTIDDSRLPVCLPFPPFEDSENPTETRLTVTEILEMDSRVPGILVSRDGEQEPCPEFPPVYCPIKSALKGVLNYDQKPYNEAV